MRVARVVFGVLGFLIGAAAIAGATVGLIADRGADDFFLSEGDRFERSSFAIASEAMDVLTVTPGWVADRLTDAVDIRVKGSSNDGSSLFVGIGASDDVEAYLAGVAYDEVDAIRFDGSDVDYLHHSGTSSPRVPGREILWVASVEGPGIQTLDWSVEQGEWTLVVMNADGSSGVDASLVRGVRLSNFVAVAWGVLAFGVISLLGGGSLMVRGVGGPRTEPSERSAGARKTELDRRLATKTEESGMGTRFF